MPSSHRYRHLPVDIHRPESHHSRKVMVRFVLVFSGFVTLAVLFRLIFPIAASATEAVLAGISTSIADRFLKD
jgi:hypothetical protein